MYLHNSTNIITMNENSKTVVAIGLSIILMVLFTLDHRDLTFVEDRYRKYVIEFIDELEAEGIEIPEQKRWSIRTDILLFSTTILGYAEGMNDDRQVNIRLHPILKFKSEDWVRFVIWHELGHDLFNIKHDTCLLMKAHADKNDDALFPIAKIEFIQYLKDNN
jgi:hypothetical protein